MVFVHDIMPDQPFNSKCVHPLPSFYGIFESYFCAELLFILLYMEGAV